MLWFFNLVQYSGITLSAVHVPGETDVMADALSRQAVHYTTEWSLNKHVTQSLFVMTGVPVIDLFATDKKQLSSGVFLQVSGSRIQRDECANPELGSDVQASVRYSHSASNDIQSSAELCHLGVVSGSRVPSLDCLASVIQSYKDQGFSEGVAATAAQARRPSIRKFMMDAWDCTMSGVPRKVSIHFRHLHQR